jgi:hypothetical protein
MQRLAVFVMLFLVACQAIIPTAVVAPQTAPPHITPTPVAPTATHGAEETNALLPSLAPLAPSPTVVHSSTFQTRFHPDGSLYVGDLISIEVIAPEGADLEGKTVTVTLPTSQGPKTAEARFGRYGIGGRLQANLIWVWDTDGLPAGAQTIAFSLPSENLVWSETATLLPQEELPPPEPQAVWAVARSRCCKVAYITHTPAERDLDQILEMIDQQVQKASQRMGVALTEPITITLLPRVLGHGGFAGQGIAVSYLDRDYIAGDEATIIHHEIIHILDGRLGGDLRPTMFVEGLAVYLTGGHYKTEPLLPRAAALLPPEPGCVKWSKDLFNNEDRPGCGLDRFIPLKRLIDNYYFEQHEIGYLEAGALIAYMVDTWGWERFSAFYRDIHPLKQSPNSPADESAAQSRAVEVALQQHFQIGLAQLEQRFQQTLSQQVLTPQVAEDLRLTVFYYDTARRYQILLDPSAYFLNAWLMDSEEMRKRNLTADYLRRPSQPENLALETMLTAAGEDLLHGDLADMALLLEGANAVLERYPEQGLQAFAAHPLAADYLALVQLALRLGYQPQRIWLEKNQARMWATTTGPRVNELAFVRFQDGWTILSASGALLRSLRQTSTAGGYGQLHKIPLNALNGGWQYMFK